MNVPCGGIHAGQRNTVQSSVIEIVLDRSDGMFISLGHRVYSLCSVRYRCRVLCRDMHKHDKEKHNPLFRHKYFHKYATPPPLPCTMHKIVQTTH